MNAQELDQKSILLVEDDEILRRTIVKCLRSKGYAVCEAENVSTAMTLYDLNSNKISLIITDFRMPANDGDVLLSYIRSISRVPIIVMTGFSGLFDGGDAFEAGANAFIPKPFPLTALLAGVGKYLTPSAEQGTANRNSRHAGNVE